VNESGCDWHVDDHGFWPESYLSDASKGSGKDQDGVNAWIALVDMPATYGGSMAVSAGSHREPWRFEAFEAIGQNRTTDGGHTKESILARLEAKRRSGAASLGACEIEKVRPDLRAEMEARKVVLDVQRGDIIFSTRTLWHKTMDVTEEGAKYYNSLGLEFLDRYSIRYTPGSAKLPKGWLAEWSAVSDTDNPGSTLNHIVNKDGGVLWYPQVWPTLDGNMDMQLDLVADAELDHAKQKVKADIAELFMPKARSESSPKENQYEAASLAATAEQS
jgi:Phytanoyl-CoA dioxygenase (PhyH)